MAAVVTRKRKRKLALDKIAVQVVFAILAFSIVFIFYYMVTNSFKTHLEFGQSQYSFPTQVRFDNYMKTWFKDGIGTAFLNTSILSLGAVAFTLFCGSLAAYVITIKKFRGDKLLLRMIVAMMYVSPMGIIIPLFVWIAKLDLIDNLYVTILIFSGFYMPFSIFLLCTYFRSVPGDLVDAARIDGCGHFRIIFEVIVPTARSGLLLLAVLNFYYVWSNLLFSLIFLRSPENQTLMTAISRYAARYGSDIPAKMAALVITTVPLVIVFLIVRKQFIRGMTLGSFR